MEFSAEFYVVIQVKGMNQWRLGTLGPYLMVDFPPDGAPTGSLSNGTVLSTASQNLAQSVMNGKLSGEYLILKCYMTPKTVSFNSHNILW